MTSTSPGASKGTTFNIENDGDDNDDNDYDNDDDDDDGDDGPPVAAVKPLATLHQRFLGENMRTDG